MMTKNISIQGLTLNVHHHLPLKHRPTLVFLHDSLGCVRLWRDFPMQLGLITNCNFLVYDRQGYGDSCAFSNPKRNKDYLEIEADILNELIQYFNLQNPILFGHSDGGSIALIAAAKYPQKIAAIITEGAHIFVEELTLEGIRAAVSAYQNTDLSFKLQKYHGTKTDALFEAWTKTWQRAEFRDWNIEHFLPKIHSPSLIIQGEADEFGSLAQVTRTVQQISGRAEAFTLPHIGHTPHKEVPQKILERVAAFIKGL